MSNVKVGDLAKLTRDRIFPRNTGALMWVEAPHTLPPQFSIPPDWNYGQLWLCRVLQPVMAIKSYNKMVIVELQPGAEFVTFDAWLQRIDPPADTDAVFGHEPLPGERWIEQQQLPEEERYRKELES